ncbi:hypothetical protein H1R82_03525 [Thermoactinomyces intermedius]|jgi:hypothetical protein|uniref:Uncharacterized protein n=1 Tax=Thermoactinomyces intermedius TaxID=2024 RepID=A0A8I1ABJ3_THEIN|nr:MULTISPECIES: hypothetical protein [Thermoactinomyces]MBA4548067.1 hypothetical protein [Thermoactinomyces intermedius]MBA4835704.1 hypothetical protein [Thermoactinomyces intermedius]MBH8594911.1 hypothetical protein [Thermoactinomyces intermedius]MBH8600429.1 hypothetical protein [Thermoactinomyces sp. CICC 23799]
MDQHRPKRAKFSGSLDSVDKLDLAGQLAELKLSFYQQSVLLSAMMDLLIEKDLLQKEEIAHMAMKIDMELAKDLYPLEQKPTEE